MSEEKHTLLVCTVGGTPEPLVASLLYWRPAYVLFVPSGQTRDQVDDVLNEHKTQAPRPLGRREYRVCPVENAQDMQDCLRVMHSLAAEVEDWLAQGSDYQVVADFTAGTKCMSAALALEARRWPCSFSYVGGERRSKGGVGVVETGSESLVHSANPWEALGYQAAEGFIALFDQRAFAAAADLSSRAMKSMTAPDKQREFSVLMNLAFGFEAWDRFDHKAAKAKFGDVLKGANDLRARIGMAPGDRLVRFIERHQHYLSRLADQHSRPTADHMEDLLANAQRRREEGRFDDAVARLYRAIEAIAQLALAGRHEIPSTARVPVTRIPEPLRSTLELRPGEDGTVRLGLQDAYALLASLDDQVGARFASSSLGDPQRSPLSARNDSILAHGFRPVSPAVFDQLWTAALDLADMKAEDLPTFPKLGGAHLQAGR